MNKIRKTEDLKGRNEGRYWYWYWAGSGPDWYWYMAETEEFGETDGCGPEWAKWRFQIGCASERHVFEQVRNRLAVMSSPNRFCQNTRNVDSPNLRGGLYVEFL